MEAVDKIIVPLNFGNAHWACGCINIRDRRVEYWDSLGGGRTGVVDALLRYSSGTLGYSRVLEGHYMGTQGVLLRGAGVLEAYPAGTPRTYGTMGCERVLKGYLGYSTCCGGRAGAGAIRRAKVPRMRTALVPSLL
jgi:hypothetical protein